MSGAVCSDLLLHGGTASSSLTETLEVSSEDLMWTDHPVPCYDFELTGKKNMFLTTCMQLLQLLLLTSAVLLNAGLVQPDPDKVVVFGGMAQDDEGAAFRLSDMFELTISQRWWRQARPLACNADCEGPPAAPQGTLALPD